MSALARAGASLPKPSASHIAAWQRHEHLDISAYGARLLVSDVRVASMLATEARQQAVTRAFGVPRQDQSWLVTIVLCGSAAAVAWDALAALVPHPTSADLKLGGSLVNATFRGLVGMPSSTMPLAGALIALALASHHVRPLVRESLRELLAVRRDLRAAFNHRYGHLIAGPPGEGSRAALAQRA